MCGIVGALAWNNFKITPNYINQLRNHLQHRGPDSQGTWINATANIGMGHQRLAILDLTREANQPMQTQNQRYTLVFNGEIYNYKAVRAKLEKCGIVQWQTNHSDTEVVLQAFAYWGINCLREFRGMYAFAIWDQLEKNLWLVRDRVGIKPLYYSFHHQRLVFASEIKALLQDPEQPRAVNLPAFYHYLSFLAAPAPSTLFQGIFKLSPGSWLRINHRGEYQEQRYWDILDHTQPLTHLSEQEIADSVRAELITSATLHQVGDVSMGVFLSGGLDSSTNAALFSSLQEKPIKTFSIGYDRHYKTYQNELSYAAFMAKKINSDHYQTTISIDDILNFLPHMVYLQDEPIGDPVCVPMYYLAKLAREQNVKVCQVGEGADELFLGYPSWKIKLKLAQLNQIPGLNWSKKLASKALNFTHPNSMPLEFLQRALRKQPIFWGGNDFFPENLKQKLLSSAIKQKLRDVHSWDVIEPIWQQFQANAWEKNIPNWMSYLDFRYRLPELLLMRTDKMSMAVSLECRVPFLDHELATLAMSIPAAMKLKKGVLKNILKKSVADIVPSEIIERPKQGFGVPVYELLFDKLGHYTQQVLTSFCHKTNYFNPAMIEQLLRPPHQARTWYLLNFALWHDTFIENTTPIYN